jgi:branched-chain amino acid transport system permease protein
VGEMVLYVALNGSLYALIALGLTLSYGIQGTLDMANPAFMVLGAYLALQILRLPIEPLAALLLVPVVLFVLGVLCYRLIVVPLRGRPHMDVALALFGLLFVIENGINFIWTADFQRIKLWFIGSSVDLLGQQVDIGRLIAPLVLVATYGLILGLLQFGPLGRLVRATYSNREAAELSGIDTVRIDHVLYGVSVAVGGIAGVVGGIAFAFSGASIIPWFLVAFTVVLMGGRGSLVGPLVASFVIALAEALTAQYLSFNWIAVVSGLATIGVLLLRPRGLFGAAPVIGEV